MNLSEYKYAFKVLVPQGNPPTPIIHEVYLYKQMPGDEVMKDLQEHCNEDMRAGKYPAFVIQLEMDSKRMRELRKFIERNPDKWQNR